jgi:5-methylcytosine-specific restriction endonuclease McrA
MSGRHDYQGMNWIRQEKRHAIYVRDGFTCKHCGEPGKTLDHVVPRSEGGSNEASNLVTACGKCNYGRKKTPGLKAEGDIDVEGAKRELRRKNAPSNKDTGASY